MRTPNSLCRLWKLPSGNVIEHWSNDNHPYVLNTNNLADRSTGFFPIEDREQVLRILRLHNLKPLDSVTVIF